MFTYIDEIKTVKIHEFPAKSRIEENERNLLDALIADWICLFVWPSVNKRIIKYYQKWKDKKVRCKIVETNKFTDDKLNDLFSDYKILTTGWQGRFVEGKVQFVDSKLNFADDNSTLSLKNISYY